MKRFTQPARLAAALTLIGASTATLANPIASDYFAMRFENSANSNNIGTGDILFWGANTVIPAGTTYGHTRICPPGADCSSGPSDPDFVKQSLYYRPFATYPTQYYASRPYDPTLTGSWTLMLSPTSNFSGGNAVSPTPAVGSVAAMPFVQSMSVQGAGLTPTISWTAPAGGPGVDQYRLRIFNVDNPITVAPESNAPGVSAFKQSNLIFDKALPASQTSYTVSAGDIALQYGTHYSIAIAADH